MGWEEAILLPSRYNLDYYFWLAALTGYAKYEERSSKFYE